SYLLNNLFYDYLKEKGVDDSHIIKISLDDDENEDLLLPKALSRHIKSLIVDNDLYYILLDEIQLADNFVGVLNGLLKLPNVDIYVTGSNSKFLSTDIVTEFRGRGDEVRILPLSFYEFMLVYDGTVADGWKDYYTYGGLPLVLSQKSEETKMNYLKGQLKNVYLNDIIDRNRIQNEEQINAVVEILASSIGSLTNPLKLSNTFRSVANLPIADKTVSNFLSYLEDAFLVDKAKRYDVKGKKYLSTPSKYYFTDLGLRNAALSFRQQEENHIMENIIYLELLKRGFSVDVGIVEVAKRNEEGKVVRNYYEVDFIANRGNNKFYIQSAFAMDTEEKQEQEKKSLMNIKDFFKKIIIVKDDIKRKRDENGIVTMSIYDFLLDEESIEY
ncbi:MAG: ATP-binding protein, partial [Clostridia bacterium]|nr:ATP-binding protein [Clostridia bacterium]